MCKGTPCTEQKTPDQLTDASKGVVHVFDKSDFVVRHRKDIEYIAQDVVVPVKSITVTRRDLSKDIEVIPED